MKKPTVKVLLRLILAIILVLGLSPVQSNAATDSVFAIFAGDAIFKDDGNPNTPPVDDSIADLKRAGVDTVILGAVHIYPNSDLYINGNKVCSGGQYVGTDDYKQKWAKLKQAPTGVTRLELYFGGAGSGTFNDLKNTILPNTTLKNTLQQNLNALFVATGADAACIDDETTYDSTNTTTFCNMIVTSGKKITLCPYNNTAYWSAVKSNLSTNCDRVYLQCYGGGAANNASSWSSSLGGSKIIPGFTAGTYTSAIQTKLNGWGGAATNSCLQGTFLWNYDEVIQCNSSDNIYNFGNFFNTYFSMGRVISNEMYNTSDRSNGYTNLSRNGNPIVTASGQINSDSAPGKAVDGIMLNSKWCDTSSSSKWLTIDLGQAQTVWRWVVKHAGSALEHPKYNTKGFILQKSDDGINFTDVDTVTDNTQAVTDRGLNAAVTARYFRLFITNPNQGADNAARIYEFELYNGPQIPQNVALNKYANSQQYVGACSPGKAVNGTLNDLNDKWCALASTSNWLCVDLGQEYDISRWVVKHAGAYGESVYYNTRDFRLQKSSSKTGDPYYFTNWEDVDTVTGNTANVTDRSVGTFSTRYVRLYIDTATAYTLSDNYARIFEFEVYGIPSTPPPPTNVALNKTATASAYVQYTEPSKAVNGTINDLYDKWCQTQNTGTKWLQVDLGDFYTINRWVVKHAGAGGEIADYNTKDFKLQYKVGSTWIDVDTVTGNTQNVTDRTVSAFIARYVRLFITTPTNNNDSAARIYEFEVYGY